MNVWYFSAYDQPKGQSPRTYDFSRKLVQRGHQVTFFTNSYCHFTHVERLQPKQRWLIEHIDGVRVVWLRTFPYQSNGLDRAVNMLSNIMRAFQASRTLPDTPDVVIGPSVPILTGLMASQIARRYDVPFIYESRDVWPDALVENGGISRNGPAYHVFRAIEKTLYKRAQRISSVLPFLADHVLQSGGDPGKIVYIPNGIEIDRFQRQTYDGGRDDQIEVMYVGGFGLAHDVGTIIRAAKLLQDAGDTVFKFTIIGKGVCESALKAQAQSYSLKNLAFKPPVPKADLPMVQKQADILIAAVTDSNLYRFGMNSNKICSYFASGRPVLLAGQVPSNPVEVAKAGLVVPPENPATMVAGLQQLSAAGPSVRREMGANARRYVDEVLNMDVLGARMESMLAGAIADYRNGQSLERLTN